MAEMMRPRLISKEQARTVAGAGGLIGVWTHLSDTPVEYARNIRALVDVIGVDHVCIGTDSKPPSPHPNSPSAGSPPHEVPHPDGPARNDFRPSQQRARVGERTNEAWADEKVASYYDVVDAMLQTGFTPDDIGKIGGTNLLRVFGAAIAH
jgi:microsomal dipeptidase-like Zn-dependent dipeptidase